MTTIYTTTINGMYTVNTPDPDYVVNVLFTVSGTDGTYSAKIDGNVQFESNQSDVFIPYNELTQDIVLGWVNSATNNLVNYYANVDGQIESMKTPPVSPQSTPLPWNQI